MALRRSLAVFSLGSSSALTTACCRASTSTAHVLPSPSPSSQQASSFHSSAVAREKKRKMVARLKKKANLARRHEAQEQLRASAPDTVRGYGPNNQNLWYESELRKILLYPEEVYEGKAGLKGMLPSLPNAKDEVLGPVGVKSDDLVATHSSTHESPTSQTDAASPVPPYFNFAMTAEDGDFLLTALPEANATLQTATNNSSLQADNMALVQRTEQHKAEATRRILDFANANARGIRFENTRRVIRRFGQGEGSGRCEVQAALLTMRIHSMADHLQKMPRDIHSKRHITRLVMNRAKILKYLKEYDLQRYVQCLSDIGVEPRAVEGAIQVKL